MIDINFRMIDINFFMTITLIYFILSWNKNIILSISDVNKFQNIKINILLIIFFITNYIYITHISKKLYCYVKNISYKLFIDR